MTRTWAEISALNISAATYLVQAGTIEVVVGEKTQVPLLATLTRKDLDIARKTLEAAQMEQAAFQRLPYANPDVMEQLYAAALIRHDAFRSKYEAALNLQKSTAWLNWFSGASRKRSVKSHKSKRRSMRNTKMK